MESGAWPFLVGGLICLVYSVNERDLILLNSNFLRGKKKKKFIFFFLTFIKNFNNYFLKGHFMFNEWKIEATTGL